MTVEIAEDFATMQAFQGERPEKPARLAYLDDKLHSGRFHAPRWATANLRGRIYRVNGQHSSRVLASANGHFPKHLNVIIDRYTCDTEEDLANLFAEFDPKASARTDTDVLNAHGRVEPTLADVTPSMMRSIVNGIAYCRSIDTSTAMRDISTEEKGRWLHHHQDYALFRNSLGHHRPLRRVGVEGAIFRTFDKNRELAHEFWIAVRDESAPDVNCPTRVLGKFLLTAVTDADRGRGQSWDARAFYYKSAHAWNAWRDGVSTQLKYLPNAPWPKFK
ncbi:MAG: hypothetical protein VKL39_24470 [Leptolyngbyaceae bacterium]|nr:hypothetical protein [Leptolyngbyaceae bacterium]